MEYSLHAANGLSAGCLYKPFSSTPCWAQIQERLFPTLCRSEGLNESLSLHTQAQHYASTSKNIYTSTTFNHKGSTHAYITNILTLTYLPQVPRHLTRVLLQL